jgi:citrate lyase beta subunit
LERAPTIVAAFESARAKGQARVAREGSLIEVPSRSNVNHLIARGEALREFHR